MDTKLCRICLKHTANISIFDRDQDLQYCAKITRCVNIVISDDDGLPNMICRPCVEELTVAYEFVQKCETSDKILRCPDVVSLTEDLTLKADVDIKIEDINCDFDYDISCDTEILDQDNASRSKIDFGDDVESYRSVGAKKGKEKRGKKKMKRSSNGSLQCVVCGLLANCRSAMETHMRTHTKEKPFKCETCDAQFPTKGALKRHILTYHTERERKFTCEMCGNSFFSKSDIITHMRIHTDEKPFVCPYCSRGFRQVASLIRHKRVHSGERPYACHICGKKFADKNLVKRHMTSHSDEKKFSCHLCNKLLKSKSALNMHLSLHSNEKRNVCSYCGMALSTKGNLQTHIRRIHSEKSGECNICFKTFSDLQEHMRKHTGVKPFVCSMCSQTFSTKRSLTHHTVFKHENSAKYKCSIGDCAKTFPRAMMLEFHLLKQHTNHTPYICQHCSRGFFRTSDLSRHLKISHLELQVKMPIKTDDL